MTPEQLEKKVAEDIRTQDFTIPVSVDVEPGLSYGRFVTSLRPLTERSLTLFTIRVGSTGPIRLTAWTSPITFQQATEEYLFVDGDDIRTARGTLSMENLGEYLADSARTSHLFRVTVGATESSSVAQFHAALTSSRNCAGDSIVWDVNGQGHAPPPAGGGHR